MAARRSKARPRLFGGGPTRLAAAALLLAAAQVVSPTRAHTATVAAVQAVSPAAAQSGTPVTAQIPPNATAHAWPAAAPETKAPATTAKTAAAHPQSIAVGGVHGAGTLAVLASRDLGIAQPDITRAVITIHGRDRDARSYDRIAHDALARAGASGAGTLLLTPRFADVGDTDLGPGTLRWRGNNWMEGGLADAPAAVGSFEALDAMLARLSDRSLFPSLRMVVLVGHSGGAQLVQRYAVLGHEPPTMTARGIQVRFLVANPSSYSYFTADRPTANGGFAPFPLDQCHRFDDWKYGMSGLPDYAGGATAALLERRYVQRDVTYLLGTDDTDPDLPALDKSCAAEAQGPNHLERGHAFMRYLRLRHPVGLNQYEYDIGGVGHDATAMLTSDCALATIYDVPLCGHVLTPPAVEPVAASVPSSRPAAASRPKPRPVRRTPQPPRPHRYLVDKQWPQPAGWQWQPGGWNWNGETYVWVPRHRVRQTDAPDKLVPAAWQFDGVGWIWMPVH